MQSPPGPTTRNSAARGHVVAEFGVWNTRYMGLALDELRAAGMRIDPDDVERLCPLVHHHIHVDGRYSFTLPEPLMRGAIVFLWRRWRGC